MEIKRVIDGKEYSFKLSPDEMEKVYREQEHNYDKKDILGELENIQDEAGCVSLAEFENALKVSVDTIFQSDYIINALTEEKRRLMDKFDLSWNNAVESAIKGFLNDDEFLNYRLAVRINEFTLNEPYDIEQDYTEEIHDNLISGKNDIYLSLLEKLLSNEKALLSNERTKAESLLNDLNKKMIYEKIKSNNKFTFMQLNEVRAAFNLNFTAEQFKFFDNPKLAWDQMVEVKEGFKSGLLVEQVQMYAKPELEWDYMREVREGFENGFSVDQVKVLLNPEFELLQVKMLSEAFERGLDIEKVKLIADPKIEPLEMLAMIQSFENGLPYEESVAENVKAILIELDYKGEYSRYALTPDEFKKEFADRLADDMPMPTIQGDSFTLRPLVHMWSKETTVKSEEWNNFFTDMSWGLSESDIEKDNLASIDYDSMKLLKQYLPETKEQLFDKKPSLEEQMQSAKEQKNVPRKDEKVGNTKEQLR